MEPDCLKYLFVPIYAEIMSESKLITPPFWEKHQQFFFPGKKQLFTITIELSSHFLDYTVKEMNVRVEKGTLRPS